MMEEGIWRLGRKPLAKMIKGERKNGWRENYNREDDERKRVKERRIDGGRESIREGDETKDT